MDASARAEKAQHFSAKWGSHFIRQWVHHWLKEHSFPGSQHGHHIKSFSLLEDPPSDHLTFPDQQKGIKQVLVEHGLWKNTLRCDHYTCKFSEVDAENTEEFRDAVFLGLFHWVDAYHSGLNAQEAQLHIRAFSSRRYKSHHYIPDAVANALN
ncbi:hypothetical protein AN958_09196 [Leucoagaricus sp. SymC.cos]|nr:hypothetical protein AN958_09196 [Leucoagaricus sp. SymC.cos]